MVEKGPVLSADRPWKRMALILGAIAFAGISGALPGGDDFPDILVTDLDSLWVYHGDGEGAFLPPTQYVIGGAVEPWAVAIGDLTCDGFPEIISANRYGPHATFFVAKGDGDFESIPRILDTPDRPYDVDLDDLDRDGDLDIAITCNYDPGAVLLFYNDGKGGFMDQESLPVGGKAFNSVLTDLDGKDGLDLVVTRNGAQDLAIYLNLGDGSFKFERNVAAGSDPKAIKAADLNGDGFQDAIVANDTAGVITLFLGDGSGGLTRKGTLRAGIQPRELVAVDLNADGAKDLVVAGGKGADFVDRFLGNNDSTFRGPVSFTTGPRPNSVDSADFDLDGKPDVAVANWSLDAEYLATCSVLYGDGQGDFPRKIDLVPAQGFRKIVAVAAGQLDQVRFLRGDATYDGHINISDPIVILGHLFGGMAMQCKDAGDVDDSGSLDITDAIQVLGWLFLGGAAPKPPFAEPGIDPTPDMLGCGT